MHDGHAPGHTAYWLPERGVLLAGGDPDDPRRADPDMEETHQRLRKLVASP